MVVPQFFVVLFQSTSLKHLCFEIRLGSTHVGTSILGHPTSPMTRKLSPVMSNDSSGSTQAVFNLAHVWLRDGQ